MAAGDAHRVWFPEMVQHLRLRWRDDLPIKDLLVLRAELDDMLGRIRSVEPVEAAAELGVSVPPDRGVNSGLFYARPIAPRLDGSRTIRFVMDLPPSHLGPGWKRKVG